MNRPFCAGAGVLCGMALLIPGCNGDARSRSIRIAVTDVASDRATVTWTAEDTGFHRFQLQKQVMGTGLWTAAAELVDRRAYRATGYQRVIGNLAPGTSYCFRVRAPVRALEAILSDSHCIVTRVLTPPVTLQILVRTGPFPAKPARCTEPVVWTFVPMRITGAKEEAAAFTVERNYDVAPHRVAGKWYCFFEENMAAPRLPSGRWQIRLHGTDWSARCVVHLRPGSERIRFMQHVRGCRHGEEDP
jgi:hypothetical protein